MTLALALETSSPVLSTALVEHDGSATRVLATRSVGPPAVTSTLVPGLFDTLLEETGRSLENVDVLVAGLGPGLFTGTRVAVATMKAIAFARQRPLIGAGSLEALAVAAARGAGPCFSTTALPDAGPFCTTLDARKGELYWALYETRGGTLVELLPPIASAPTGLIEALSKQARPVRVVGTGMVALQRLETPAWLTLDDTSRTPRAAEVAALALDRTPRPVFDLAAVLALEPSYLRPPEAEVARKRREFDAANQRG